MANIKFGTDGWRAIVGEDFTKDNVAIVTKAIGKYVYDTFGVEKRIIIGYDPRNMALEFSKQIAQQLSEYGFEIYLSDKVLPTPVLAYSAKILNACAIMLTASHNPPEYLGIKFIPDYAGPATSEITDEIVANMDKDFNRSANKCGMQLGTILDRDFSKKYFEHIKTLIDFEKIKTLKSKIIFDGLYSAAIGYFDELLNEFDIPFEELHMEHDPNFGGGMPEPKPKYLGELIEIIKSENANGQGAIGLSNDGDADRFGVINENGQYVSPNEIIAILLVHLYKNKGLKGPLVKTVGASLMLDKIAQSLDVEVIETAVGFKHVGEAMRKFNPIIAGEESGGLSIQGHIPEKDGILANLLVLEAMAYAGKSLVELQSDLSAAVGCKFFNERLDLKLKDQSQVDEMLHFAQYEVPKKISVAKIDIKDGVKLYLSDNATWILVRPSGTEPLLRVYFESDEMGKIKELSGFFKL